MKTIKSYWKELLNKKVDDEGRALRNLKIKVKLLEAETYENGICLTVMDCKTKIIGYVLLFPFSSSDYYNSIIFHLYETFSQDIWLYGFLLSEKKKVFVIDPLICYETL